MIAVLVSLLIISSLCLAQPAPGAPDTTQPKPARVEGRVVHLMTGAPVRKAAVALRPAAAGAVMLPGQPLSGKVVSTDAEGAFAFEDVAPGTYRLSAERQGFLRQEYGARQQFSQGTVLRVSAGESLTGLVYKLTPQGVISGKVLDEEGEPLERVFVNVMRWGFNRGRRQLMPVSGASANDLGEFRSAGLAPGKYFVCARPEGLYGRIGATTGQRPTEGYVTTYYPGVTDSASAVPVEVQPGQDVSGITIRLLKSRVYRVSGKVTGLADSTGRISVSLMPRDRSNPMGGFGAGSRPDGSFEMLNVTPGSYYVVAMRFDRTPTPIGRVPIEVTNSDVEGIIITGGAAIPEVRGTVRVEGEASVNLKQVQVALTPVEMMPYGLRPVPLNEKAAFVFEQVAREKFMVMLMPPPDGTYIKTVRAGDQDVTKTGIDLTNAESAPPIEVILSAKPATIEGVVARASAEDPPGNVVLLPDPWQPEEPSPMTQFFRPGLTVDQTGRFTIRNVAPGKYRLYAFEEFNPQEMMDPDLFKALQSKSEALEVSEGEHKIANPRQIRTSEVAERR